MSTTATTSKGLDKLPSTNTNAYRAAMRTYLANATEVEGNNDEEHIDATEDERIAYMIKRFESEASWNIARVGAQAAATDWLQGLAINVEFQNHNIPPTVLRIHGLKAQPMSARLERVVIDGWWQHLGYHVARLRAAKG